jgi:hypothetical protein
MANKRSSDPQASLRKTLGILVLLLVVLPILLMIIDHFTGVLPMLRGHQHEWRF